MKYGMRTPSWKKSLSARTKGRATRAVKRALIPGYGKRTERNSPFNRMVRVAVGLEDPKDLIADLQQAFEKLAN